ncbi:pyrroline-5-carboxylate reductase family protein [Candidatus Omnitrophota bacterium]
MNKNIGIIGFGNMGSAIAGRLAGEFKVTVFDQDKTKTAGLKEIKVAVDSSAVLRGSETVILAVKPQDFRALLDEIREEAKEKLIISIAAGITTASIEKALRRARVVRAMPNLPARIGKGMICISAGSSAGKEDLEFARRLFTKSGEVLVLKEEMIDAATAVSGSGPGYLYQWCQGKSSEEAAEYVNKKFIPALEEAAAGIGFTPQEAGLLARTTAKGSLAFLEASHATPAELTKQVASKGGTTEAGLAVLRSGGSLSVAVKAAKTMAEVLSRKE